MIKIVVLALHYGRKIIEVWALDFGIASSRFDEAFGDTLHFISILSLRSANIEC